MARGISFAFLIVAAAAACVGDSPETTNPTPTPGGDGGTSSSGGPSGTNLVENGSFENGCAEPEFSSNGTMTSFTTFGRTGAKACKVCKIGGAEPTLYLYARFDLAPKKGESYAVSAYVRKDPDAPNSGNSEISMSGIDGEGGAIANGDEPAKGPIVISDEWKVAEFTLNMHQDGAVSARVDLGTPAAKDGDCFLVDDLSVTRK